MRPAFAALGRSTAAGGAARVGYAALRRYPPAGEKTWTRTNHRGEPVTLLEGPAVALGAVAAQCFFLSPERSSSSARTAQALALAGAGALGFGVYDDLAGSGKRRGLRGHLGALARGEVTTGSVKLAGLAASALASALVLASGGSLPAWGTPAPHTPRPPEDPRHGGAARSLIPSAADVAVNAGLIAGGANLLNLFDLRPGRAIKVAAASAALIAAGSAVTGGGSGGGGSGGGAAVAAPFGAALAMAPEDLGERAMLGDAGANALGAMLGCAAAVSLPRPARVALLAGIVALTVASEKVSFTKVIGRTPPLRWLDMLGRRPQAPAPQAVPQVPARQTEP
jgi:UDP-GlcNAc:undecaprenyl-phosphate GlcNAc-1-phosphate transferase